MELTIRVHVKELPEGLYIATSDELPGLIWGLRALVKQAGVHPNEFLKA